MQETAETMPALPTVRHGFIYSSSSIFIHKWTSDVRHSDKVTCTYNSVDKYKYYWAEVDWAINDGVCAQVREDRQHSSPSTFWLPAITRRTAECSTTM